jgi:hypothetical protein
MKKHELEVKVMSNDKPLKNTAMCHELQKLTPHGQFAKELAHCMVMAQISNTVQGHEGRALSNQQIVTSACDLAVEFYHQALGRGWLVEMPTLDELSKDTSSPPGFRVVS